MTENRYAVVRGVAAQPFKVEASAVAAFETAKRDPAAVTRTLATFPDLHVVSRWAHVRLTCFSAAKIGQGDIFADAVSRAAFRHTAITRPTKSELVVSTRAMGAEWMATVTLNELAVWPAEITVDFCDRWTPLRVTHKHKTVDGLKFCYVMTF
jgi:hypothetical protein